MVSKSLKYQNASSLNGPLEEFIESIQCTKNTQTTCGNPTGIKNSCFVQCLLKNSCVEPTSADQPLSSCSAEQILLFGIGTVIFLSVQRIILNKTGI